MAQVKAVIFGVFVMATTACAQAGHYPLITRADVPLYPAMARALNMTGTVEIQVVVDKGAVTDAEVKSIVIDTLNGSLPRNEESKRRVGRFLSNPSLSNVKTWHFESEVRTSFVVKYVYRIAGQETALPENPSVSFDLPTVRVTAKPVKPTVLYGSS
jgi:hypothetical protein